MLQVDGLCKSYHGHRVLDTISFCLPAGQCIGVTGENGSGKSTLLRLLAQVERPDCGDIRFREQSVLGDRKFLRSHLGYVPQQNDLMQDMTVRSQLKLWQSACGLSGPLPEDIMELLGIGPMMGSRISTLSGGMQRRVSIAMALLNAPDILIMDEATTGLDADYSVRLLGYLENFIGRGGSLIWCSHQTQELDRLCGSRLKLSGGCRVY